MKKIHPFLIFMLLIFTVNTVKSATIVLTEDSTLQSRSSFPVGAYITTKYMVDTMYVKRIIDEFESVTIGAMKMKVVSIDSAVYDFSIADSLVNFAQNQGKRIHAHTLIWGSVPDWVTNYVGDSVAWENLMKNHIQTLVTRYKDKAASWDVVNEAIDDNGNVKTDNIWCQHLGTGYIERAFIYAHEADSNALLFYNDYGHEYSNTRLNAIVSMLNDFKTRDIPVHGIGMQMHTRYNLGDDQWKNAIKAAASTGLKVHLSELDISLNPDMDTSFIYTQELGEVQKQKFRYIFQAYLAIPDTQKYGITTWGVGDNDSWKRIAYPLIFDINYLKKPAYYGILESFNNLSETNLFFPNAVTGYPSKYSFNTGDNMYLSQGRNSSTSNVCPGKNGVSRTYRVQEHTFVLELNSTSMDSICIYGCGTSNNARNITKVEISDVSKDGPFTNITNSVSIGSSVNSTSCGNNLRVGNINAERGSYVKFTISLTNDTTTRASVNISELLIFPIIVQTSGQQQVVSRNLTDNNIIINSNKAIKLKDYYTIMGLEANEKTKGLIIEKVTFEDGSILTNKVYRSN